MYSIYYTYLVCCGLRYVLPQTILIFSIRQETKSFYVMTVQITRIQARVWLHFPFHVVKKVEYIYLFIFRRDDDCH